MAITFSALQGAAQGSSGTLANTMPAPVAVKDLLVGLIAIPGASSNHSPTIADNVNVGAWNMSAPLHFANIGINIEIVMGWIACDTVGTPVVTASSLGTDFTFFSVARYIGFVNGPALVSADITTNSGTSTTLASSALTNSVTNELTIALATYGGGQNITGVTGSFTNRDIADASIYIGDTVKSTSGNALTFGGTITSAHWGVMLASFNDPAPSGAPPLMNYSFQPMMAQ
jgi:hypothetical protein